MKISELAKRSNVSKETIHYYVREGVLRKPRKTGKNTAEYSEDYIDQICIIKELRDNYFLPLPVIKKIINKNKRQSRSEIETFHFLSEYFRPVDLLLSDEILGEEAYCRETGLNKIWLKEMERWGIVTVMQEDGQKKYSRDSVIIGKLLVDMDNIGFGPKNGFNPEDLRPYANILHNLIAGGHKKYFLSNLDQSTTKELQEKGGRLTEIMSLFFYHLYRQFARDAFDDFVKLTSKINK